ncbi:hypothetical protein [Thiorhodococcus minor]|uniref:Uncharacterized protein n=1 Tax=Thiorhodococcus minor TaxID=57489 RepID=A0A6M0K617_9GAMM|nr:hypothetical protein [Thiorhodococcus minor]NEV65226.1 hypothetical protein [Thiorhodococcus minor]
MSVQQIGDIRGIGLADEPVPVSDQLHGHERIVNACQMGCGNGPWPVFWPASKRCSHGIALHIPGGSEQMSLVHDEGMGLDQQLDRWTSERDCEEIRRRLG